MDVPSSDGMLPTVGEERKFENGRIGGVGFVAGFR